MELTSDLSEARRAIAGVYSRAAPTYDRFASSYHSYFAERLAGRVHLEGNSSVLDLGCGTGVLARAALPRLPDGCVVAVDIAARMVATARDRLRAHGSTSVHCVVSDAAHLALGDGSFDAVFCAFALHIVPEPDAAAAEIARVLRDGGTMACSAWAEEDPRWAWEDELFAPPSRPLRAGQRDLSSEGALAALLAPHFARVRVETEDYDAVLRDEEEWWAWKWSYGFRRRLEAFDPPGLARVREAAFTRMQQQREPSGFPVRLRARLATATRA